MILRLSLLHVRDGDDDKDNDDNDDDDANEDQPLPHVAIVPPPVHP